MNRHLLWVGLVIVGSALLVRVRPIAEGPLQGVTSAHLSIDGVRLGDSQETALHQIRLRDKSQQHPEQNLELDASGRVAVVYGNELAINNKPMLVGETNRDQITAILGTPTDVHGIPAMCAFSARPFWEAPQDGFLEYRESRLQVAFGRKTEAPYRLAVDGTPDDTFPRRPPCCHLRLGSVIPTR